jgi:hypothetical protein
MCVVVVCNTGTLLCASVYYHLCARRPTLKRQRKVIVAKEQDGVASALERCCEHAKELCATLREKEPGTLDIGALAQLA